MVVKDFKEAKKDIDTLIDDKMYLKARDRIKPFLDMVVSDLDERTYNSAQNLEKKIEKNGKGDNDDQCDYPCPASLAGEFSVVQCSLRLLLEAPDTERKHQAVDWNKQQPRQHQD